MPDFAMATFMREMLEVEGLPSGWQSSKKSIPTSVDVDVNVWRARVLGITKIFDVGGDDNNEAKLVLDKLSALNSRLSKQAATKGELYDALKEIAALFSSTGPSLSSFELLRGGVIDGLLEFVDIDGTVSSAERRSMLYEIFAETAPSSSASPMTVLVKRLHESLGRLETFNVESAFNGAADPTRPGAPVLTRTLRVRLSAEPGQDVPKHISNLLLTIQAIAPLSALHDYLRPRVVETTPASGSGISRMFAAYGTGRGGLMSDSGLTGSSSRLEVPGRTQPQASSSTAPPPELGSSAPTDSSLANIPTKSPAPKTNRRRSARLSAQHPDTEIAQPSAAEAPIPAVSTSIPAPASAAAGPSTHLATSLPESAGLVLPMDMDFDEDYSDGDYDEEMFESEMAAAALARHQEKVVNMNVTSGRFWE
jgi:E3 ubiquitin-protein ligase TRIP12